MIMLNGGKMKKLPPRKPLTEVVKTVVNRRQRGGLLTADATSVPQSDAEGNGGIMLSRGGYRTGDWWKTFVSIPPHNCGYGTFPDKIG